MLELLEPPGILTDGVVPILQRGFAREVGDQNVFMDEGAIVEQGPRGFFETCSNPRTRDFLAAVL